MSINLFMYKQSVSLFEAQGYRDDAIIDAIINAERAVQGCVSRRRHKRALSPARSSRARRAPAPSLFLRRHTNGSNTGSLNYYHAVTGGGTSDEALTKPCNGDKYAAIRYVAQMIYYLTIICGDFPVILNK